MRPLASTFGRAPHRPLPRRPPPLRPLAGRALPPPPACEPCCCCSPPRHASSRASRCTGRGGGGRDAGGGGGSSGARRNCFPRLILLEVFLEHFAVGGLEDRVPACRILLGCADPCHNVALNRRTSVVTNDCAIFFDIAPHAHPNQLVIDPAPHTPQAPFALHLLHVILDHASSASNLTLTAFGGSCVSTVPSKNLYRPLSLN